MTIEGFSFLDALYQTITAVTTAGFGEINPLGSAGQVFTIIIIILGVIVILYVLTAVMQIAVEGELESILGARRMKTKIEALKNHYILCGFGRVGTEIAREFTTRGVPFVIVDSNPEAIARAQAAGYLLVEGDATSDAVLGEARIERARGLLAASDSDAGNTFVVLTAKALRPDLYVVSRAGRTESRPRMERAGADRAISPYAIAGRRMALSALQPLMVEFIERLPPATTVLLYLYAPPIDPADPLYSCDGLATLHGRYRALARRRDHVVIVDAGSVADSSTPGYYADSVHPSPQGSAVIGALVAAAVEDTL